MGGSAIYFLGGIKAKINNCTFKSNEASIGGSIYMNAFE